MRTIKVALLLVAWSMAGVCGALDDAALRAVALGWFDGAQTIGAPTGEPPAAEVRAGNRLLGHVFFSADIAPIPAYSGRPVNVMVGIDLNGVITGVRIVSHEEPILAVGVSEQDIARFVDQYDGLDAAAPIRIGGRERPGLQRVDGISGATITVMVMNSTISRAAREVMHTRPKGTLDASGRAPPEQAPAKAQASAPAQTPEVWRLAWEDSRWRLLALVAGLVTLTTILFLQDWLTRYPKLIARLRAAFLVYTLVYIGWYALAQLSVINVFTFMRALTSRFSWETFLIDPMLFVLWGFVAVTLLLWGRGVYCGWLCPFGALQELTNRLAQRLRVPQWPIPELVHERLLAIKYVILIGLFGLSLQSMIAVVPFAEVEPFKTAITLRFQREPPYVAYAMALVLISLVNGKFYCKYLCPLGAALAIGSHFRIFDWLHRRRECGRPCQTCATQCPSQAIRVTGEIDARECHHCLDCQVTFWDPYKCPPLVERRKRFERRGQPVKLTL